jgi:cytochrome P450
LTLSPNNIPMTKTLLDAALADGSLERNPFPIYRALHESGARHTYSEAWNAPVFFKYTDLAEILRRPQEFSNRGRVVNHLKIAFPTEASGDLKPLADHYSAGLINSDPPDHTRLRRLIQQAFLPRMLERLRPRVDEICTSLVARLRTLGTTDFVSEFAFQLPVTVIAEMLAIPHSMRDQFKDWSVRIVEFMASPNPPLAAMRRSQASLLELRAYFSSVFEERRKHPGEDVISLLVNARDSGEKLTEEELLSTCVTLLIGGHETTTALLASSLWLIGTNADLRADLLANPDELPSAVEEFLRLQPPFQRILRVAASDIEFAGVSLKEGQAILLMLGAANRDFGQFPDPDRLDIRRSPNKHLSFGYGMHHCLGAALARLETPAALGHLLRAFPDFECEPEPVWHDGMVRAIKKLEIIL